MQRSRMIFAAAAAVMALLVAVPGSAVPPDGPSGQIAWSPGNPEAGRDATFTISASDSDGLILSAVIEYGDGTQDQIVAQRSLSRDVAACLFGDYFVASRTHSYAQAGDYQAKLTITSGACPLTEALQETKHIVTKKVSVLRAGAKSATAEAPESAPAP